MVKLNVNVSFHFNFDAAVPHKFLKLVIKISPQLSVSTPLLTPTPLLPLYHFTVHKLSLIFVNYFQSFFFGFHFKFKVNDGAICIQPVKERQLQLPEGEGCRDGGTGASATVYPEGV